MPEYDIIILGAGMAGLSLAYRGLISGTWKNKKILIIEKELKAKNDKTFCFWSQKNNKHLLAFEPIIKYKWDQMKFFKNSGNELSFKQKNPQVKYQYNLIHSLDFYDSIFSYLKLCDNVDIKFDLVRDLIEKESKIIVTTSERNYSGEQVFDTRPLKIPTENETKSNRYQYFVQHFKGVKLEIKNHNFDLNNIHLMDFRTNQNFGTSFFYLLPFNKNQIFVEYTLFNKKLLDQKEYDNQIQIYLKKVLNLDSKNYKILETEFGVIPMTNFKFERQNTSGRVINLGARGGDTRGSTGYTFYNTQRTITSILENYQVPGQLIRIKEPVSNLNKYFDSIFLRVLNAGNYQGSELFGDIFKNASIDSILSFLDGEASFKQSFEIINSVQKLPFIKAL